jgi:hypothetical protein
MREGRFCAILFEAARKPLILKRRDVGVVDRARLESVGAFFGDTPFPAPEAASIPQLIADCASARAGPGRACSATLLSFATCSFAKETSISPAVAGSDPCLPTPCGFVGENVFQGTPSFRVPKHGVVFPVLPFLKVR